MKKNSVLSTAAFCAAMALSTGLAVAAEESATTMDDQAAETEAKAAEAVAEEQAAKQKKLEEQGAEMEAEEVSGD